ncbi:urease accessory protein UreD [Streptomyces sp. 7-21]|uniref:urease accessory protein UreD n=1 Tax=Streptomyces sp. 7-21 TaxID=2802283 RepID=UPI00191E0AF7|nr:urease accessory protein UreD [Streptomyces sp. 7-21]MBL1068858.1 urease accessory protein UreD [Streptomyces sp. 7-21]
MTRPARGAVTAEARITAGPGGTLPELRGGGPFAPRRTGSGEPGTAHVTLVGAMTAPLNGDRLRLSATAAPGAALRVTSAAATVALPGPAPVPAAYDVRLAAGERARLAWLPEPLVCARGSELAMTTRVDLAASARLRYREEQVLGRAGEETGRLTARLTVWREGWPLLDQELAFGPGVPGWDGGAVLGGHRAVGQLLVVEPAWEDRPPAPAVLGETAVLTPLAGPAVLVTALAPDALALRRLLDEAAARLPDWP